MKGLRCLLGEQPGRGSLISERKELKVGEEGAAPTFPSSPPLPDAASGSTSLGFPWFNPGQRESGAGQTLGLWWLSGWESPACSDFTLLSNF